MGREITLPALPQRIISLVPSQTELLCHLGLEDRLVGVTKFCVHPDTIRKEKVIVGGTKQFRFELIEELAPDLIIGNKEENYQEGIELLTEKHPVWMSDIFNLEDSLDMILSVSEVCGTKEKGEGLIRGIKNGFGQLPVFDPVRALYLIWRKPYMAAGSNNFIHQIMIKGGFENVVGEARYPELDEEELKKLDPEVVLLSSEPYPFATKHQEELQQIMPEAKVMLVDGELFSWYGSRLLKLPAYLRALRAEIKNRGGLQQSSPPY